MEKSTSCYLERQKQKVTMGQVLGDLAYTSEMGLGKASPSRWSAELWKGRGQFVE